jgi:transcriptional regulator GlxA family with amidase domain
MESAPFPRRIVLLIFPQFQLLDLAGPLEVFAGGNQWAENEGHGRPYAIEIVAPGGGVVPTSTGVPVAAQGPLPDLSKPTPVDTVVVTGGPGMRAAAAEPAVLPWLREAARTARRMASVCNGAFLLARAGLLDGRRAATHWALCPKLRREHPAVEVDRDALFVRDGKFWTSAGVTAGTDLSLALVEEDLGHRAALTIARWLVLFVKRPGGQSQFSEQLALQSAESEPLREVQGWISGHLGEDLSVPALARRAAMSPRHFARVFKSEVGLTPARYVERLRLEAARNLLESTALGVDAIAGRCGLGTAETLRRAFHRKYAVSPDAYRQHFQSPAQSPVERGREETLHV